MIEEISVQRFAILIPAYNSTGTLVETLAALAGQEGLADGCVGVFLADDGSTDGTANLAERTWTGPVSLHVHRAAANRGERVTVNAAMERLRDLAEWVLIVHADDIPKPDWYRTMRTAALAAAPSVASVCSSWDNFDGTGQVDLGEDLPNNPVSHHSGAAESVHYTLQKGCWWHISGCAIRSEGFVEVGPFDPEMPQLGDYDWLLRCFWSGHGVDYVPRTLLRYRIHTASVSAASFRQHRDVVEWRRVITKYGGDLDPAVRRRLYRERMGALLRRIARSVLTRDARRARSAASLIGRLAVDLARGELRPTRRSL